MNSNNVCLSSGILTQQETSEFQKLVAETMGTKLPQDEAEDQGSRLIMVFEALQKFEPIQLSYKDSVETVRKESKNGVI